MEMLTGNNRERSKPVPVLLGLPVTMVRALDAVASNFRIPRLQVIRQAIEDYLAYLEALSSASQGVEAYVKHPDPTPGFVSNDPNTNHHL